MKWLKNEIKKSIELVELGYNYVQIGKFLNRSRSSVKNKLNELGYVVNRSVIAETFRESLKCQNCSKTFEGLKKENRKFCSQSCAVIYNNTGRIVSEDTKEKISYSLTGKEKKIKYVYVEKEVRKCIFCDNPTKRSISKFCSLQCQGNDRKQKIKDLIELDNSSQTPRQYKLFLIDKYGNKCMGCGWDKINPITNKVPIELEHIDGNSENNKLDNLKLLCPNCHSLTPTYKALNIGNGRHSRRERYKSGKSF